MRSILALSILITTALPVGATQPRTPAQHRAPAAAVYSTKALAKQFGLGLEVGTLVAITGKYFFEREHAVDFGLGFGFDSWTTVYADYLFHRAHIFGVNTKFLRETAGYVGAGGGLSFHPTNKTCGRWNCKANTSTSIGIQIRVPVGLEWQPASAPFGAFFELIPEALIASAFGVGIDVGIGGRYYF